MDYIPKTIKGEGRGWTGEWARDKSQRGGEVRREWNGEGALGELSLHFCPGAPEFQVTPLLGGLLSYRIVSCHSVSNFLSLTVTVSPRIQNTSMQTEGYPSFFVLVFGGPCGFYLVHVKNS